MDNSPQACIVCFSMNVKLYNLESGTLRRDFQMLTGLNILKVGLLQHLCFECAANVRRFIKFRDKCHRAFNYLLQLLSESTEISTSHLLSVNRQNLGIMPSLTCSDVENVNYKDETSKSIKRNTKKVFKQNSILVNESENDKKVSEWDVYVENETNVKDEVIEEDKYPINSDPDYFTDENDDVPLGDLKKQNDKSEDVSVDNKIALKIEEEYAFLYPISSREAKAAAAVSLLYQKVGDYNCAICKKSFKNEKTLTEHIRMHDLHMSGTHHCNICKYYYRTELLLQTHMKEKHMYKYICKQCHEVNFDRSIAKQHYVLSHLNKKETMGTDWFEIRPKWLKKKTEPKPSKCRKKPVKKTVKKTMADHLFDRTAISQEEQYRMVQDRMSTHNYLRSQYKCEMCFKGFKRERTYNKHMIKHDPTVSGKFECDMCKLRCKNTRQMYAHMKRNHLYKYSCRLCDFVCHNNCQVNVHYRWHNNVTYPCSFCDRVFKKQSSCLTHIRINHPSMCVCRFCGHSFVNKTGLNCHIRIAHKNEATEESSVVDKSSELYCAECEVQFVSRSAFDTHLGSSNKHVTTNISSKFDRTVKDGDRKRVRHGQDAVVNIGKTTASNCEVCGKHLPNDVQARKHYESEHPGTDYLKRFMCDVCGYTTKNYQNLIHHIRSHTQEKPYKCPHCSKMFSQPGNMKRHLDIHTGEKRFVCEHCNRRFAQKITMKLHVQTVHFKIPHPPWNKKNRKRRLEAKAGAVPAEPCCSATHKLLPDAQGDYYSAYVNSFNDFLG